MTIESKENQPLILIVDNDTATGDLVEDIINGEAFGRVIKARDNSGARKVLEQLSEQGLNVTLLWLDPYLPDESGFALLREPSLKNVQLLVATLLDNDQTRAAAQTHNLLAFYSKPFDVTDVIQDMKKAFSHTSTKSND